MAIVQISRIQHRKGLQQDLPQLASAELGWSVDTRQLYIGNGTITEGAPTEGVTEILTEFSDLLNIGNQYIFKGSQSGYTSQTGATTLAPITRTLQQKLDDTVSVRDFGAVGDGVTDDTSAIQRAIDEIVFGSFALNQSRLRRRIHFAAGTYIISSSLKLPSYVTLVGAGLEKTILQTSSAISPLMQLKDSSTQVDGAYGTLGAQTAKYINIQDMTLEHQGSKNIVQLDSVDNVNFTRVLFKGGQSAPNSTSTVLQNAVYAVPTDSTKDVNNITFVDCVVTRCTQGLVLCANNVKIIGCDISTVSRGVWVDATLSAGAECKNIKIASCAFENIAKSAVYVVAASATARTNVISIGNYFGEIGTAYSGAGSTSAPVISFTGSGNYSISDAFERTDADSAVHPRVYHADNSINTSIDANVGVTTGMITRGTGRVFAIAAGQTDANTGIILSGVSSGSASVHYILERPDASAYRHGKIDVVFTGTNVQYIDEYIEYPNNTVFTYPGPTGVTFSVSSVSSGVAKINYTSDGSGAGTLTYSITKFQI
jgi:hypothetical protein